MSDKAADEKFLDRPLDVVQHDVYLLDAIKGLEAFADMITSAVAVSYPEFKETTEAERESNDNPEDQPTIDDLHHFIRETRRFAKGARQQLEQRIFGGK